MDNTNKIKKGSSNAYLFGFIESFQSEYLDIDTLKREYKYIEKVLISDDKKDSNKKLFSIFVKKEFIMTQEMFDEICYDLTEMVGDYINIFYKPNKTSKYTFNNLKTFQQTTIKKLDDTKYMFLDDDNE